MTGRLSSKSLYNARMLWSCPSAASTRSALEPRFRLALAIAGSSRSPRTQAHAAVILVRFDPLELVGFPIVSQGCPRNQVHETDEEQDQSDGDDQAGDRAGDGPRSRPSLVLPERRDEDAAAHPEGCGTQRHQPPPLLR